MTKMYALFDESFPNLLVAVFTSLDDAKEFSTTNDKIQEIQAEDLRNGCYQIRVKKEL